MLLCHKTRRKVGKVKTGVQDAGVEQGLSERTLIGSSEAFAELVRMHSPKIYQVSLRMLKNHADAEDNLQTVLCKAYGSLHRFEGRSRFSTWLVSITINQALMQIRDRRPEPLALDLLNSEKADGRTTEVSDHHPNPERRYMAKELVAKAFAGLTPSVVELFIQYESEGWTQRELAREKGITISSVKSRIFRARERMLKQLEAVC